MKAIIAGGGFIARTHIKALRSLGHEVARVVGNDPERTRAFAEENGIPSWTTDLDTALAGDASVVHICSPPGAHADMIRRCLKAGKNIICEKPLCIDASEAAALAKEAYEAYEEKGLITALCCNVRYYPANIEAARLLREEGSGDVKVVSGSYLQQFHIPPHDDGWRFDPERNGGQRAVSEIGPHWFDLAQAWTGVRIKEVCATEGSWYPYRYRAGGRLTEGPDGEKIRDGSEDTAAVLMRFENGGLGTLLLSETAPGHSNDLSIEVTDLRKTYRWEEAQPGILQYSGDGSMCGAEVPALYDDPSQDDRALDVRERTFAALFRDVYAAADGRPHGVYPTFEDGAYIAAVCAAVKESSRTGKWISV